MEEKKKKSSSADRKRKKSPASGRKTKGRNRINSGSRTLALVTAAALIIGSLFMFLGYRAKLKREAEEFARRYPMKYTELITLYALENDLEPAYVAAVVLAESSYDPSATSSVGAQGLMQIMPETGEWIAGKFDAPYYEGCLYDVETNLRYGCWYLGYLMRRYDMDKTCSSSAYHSGQGTVDKWLQDPEYSSDGKTLDVIGGSNAQKYVARILDYYEVYKGLYEED